MNYQKNKIEKFGQYFRPIFWAYLMTFSFLGFVMLLDRMFSPGSRELREAAGIPYLIFLIIVLIVVLLISGYKVTHPHFSKNDYDDSDENWGGAAFFLIPLTVNYFIFFFWNINILGFIWDFLNILL